MSEAVLGLTPPYDRYIVEMLDPAAERKTAGGLYLPEAVDGKGARPEDQRADTRRFRILSRGPGLWLGIDGEGRPVRQPLQYAVGSVVLAIRPMEADGFDWEGRRLYVLAEASVTAG